MNPVLAYDIRRVRAIGSIQGVKRYTWWVVGLAVLFLLIAVGLGILGLLQQPNTLAVSTSLAELFFLYGTSIIAITFYTALVPELASVFFSVGLIVSERQANRLELVRLAVDETAYVNAKHALAMARTWRFTVIWAAARVLGLLCWGVGLLFVLPQYNFAQEFPPEFMAELPWVLMIYLPLGLLLIGVLIMEPIWRMQATTALGINISSRTGGHLMASMLGLLGLFGLNAVLGTINSVLVFPLGLGPAFLFSFIEEDSALLPILVRGYFYGVLPLALLLGAALTYFFYRFAQRLLVQDAVKVLERAQ